MLVVAWVSSCVLNLAARERAREKERDSERTVDVFCVLVPLYNCCPATGHLGGFTPGESEELQ